ncbi:hypothetical protein C8J57DRAFT_1477483 [Mycena rebaudengoi]|nr:hypothetical protein C8J57DRAFT_1477483 [Mycena rebaudengoi]
MSAPNNTPTTVPPPSDSLDDVLASVSVFLDSVPTPATVSTSAPASSIVLAPLPPPLVHRTSVIPVPLSRLSTISLNFDDTDAEGDDDLNTSASAPVAPIAAATPKGKGKAKAKKPVENAQAGPSGTQQYPSHAEICLQSMELQSRPPPPNAKAGITMLNAVRQDAHTVAAFGARLSQQISERNVENELRFDELAASIQALAGAVQNPAQGAAMSHTDDALLAGLANGHNNTVAHIEEMQSTMASFETRLAAMETITTTNTATLGEVNRALRNIVARLASLAPAALAPILAPVSAPAAVPSLADFTAAMQSTLVAALKRSNDDDDAPDSRNVRPRIEAPVMPVGPPPLSLPPVGLPPVSAGLVTAPTGSGPPPSSTAGLVHALSKNPPARINDLTKEVVFGPAIWPSNIHAAARTIITEGLESAKPLLRLFYTRRGPDTSYIIVGFESAEAAAWFVAAWTANRSAWHTIAASPNA